jgi:hypothetical protein
VSPRSGENRCTLCGEEFALPENGKPRTMIAGASGKPNLHIISVDGVEVHRCEVQPQMGQDDVDSEAQAS